VSGVEPGTYLSLDRTWKPGDVIGMELDMAPRIWAGEREAAGRASLYQGPILLTYDPRFNPGKAEGPPALDARQLDLSPATWSGRRAPLLLVEVKSPSGSLLLCDFASAGFDGSPYRSWLRIDHASPVQFRRDRPWRTKPAGANP
jgi:hypothetical protein